MGLYLCVCDGILLQLYFAHLCQHLKQNSALRASTEHDLKASKSFKEEGMKKKAALLCQSLPPYGLKMDDVISTSVSLPLFMKTFLTCTKAFLLLATQRNSLHLSNVTDGKQLCQ